MTTSYLLKVSPEHLPLGNHVHPQCFHHSNTTWFKVQSTALCILFSATVENIFCPISTHRADLVDHFHYRSMCMHVKELPGFGSLTSFTTGISKSHVLFWKTQYRNFAHVLMAWMALSYKGCTTRVVSFSVVAYIKIGKIIDSLPVCLVAFCKALLTKCGNSATAGLEKQSILN